MTAAVLSILDLAESAPLKTKIMRQDLCIRSVVSCLLKAEAAGPGMGEYSIFEKNLEDLPAKKDRCMAATIQYGGDPLTEYTLV